jgi:hypothetical protein
MRAGSRVSSWCRKRRTTLPAVLGLAATLVLAACGGGDGHEPPAATATATPAAATQTEPATEGTTPSPTPTATATPEPARDPGAEAAAAIEAASALLDAAHIEPFNRDSCLEANPESLICISLQSPPAQVAAGIARFRAGDLEGGAFIFFMGRKADGTWALWFATQQRYDVLDSLPGLLLTCGGGRPVTVREGPSATAVETGAVEHRSELVAAEFVLEEEGTLTAGGQWGSGWYRVTSPVSGWVSDADVTDAGLGDCLLHDDLRGERG